MYLRIKAITFLIVLLHANFTMATNNYDYNQKNDFLLLDNGNENLLVPPLDIKSKIDTFLEDHKTQLMTFGKITPYLHYLTNLKIVIKIILNGV